MNDKNTLLIYIGLFKSLNFILKFCIHGLCEHHLNSKFLKKFKAPKSKVTSSSRDVHFFPVSNVGGIFLITFARVKKNSLETQEHLFFVHSHGGGDFFFLKISSPPKI